MGTALKGIYTREQAVDMVEKAILLFKREAEPASASVLWWKGWVRKGYRPCWIAMS